MILMKLLPLPFFLSVFSSPKRRKKTMKKYLTKNLVMVIITLKLKS
jgi:hypothetical protein